MADAAAAADPNRASNRPTEKQFKKITTPHPPQSVERKSTKDALALYNECSGMAPRIGRSTGEGMLPELALPVDDIEKKYKLAKQTGTGSFSQTFKAIGVEDGQLTCVKSILKSNLAQAKTDQYDAEIFKWAPKRNSVVSIEARHPNVANLFRCFQDADNLHIVMPEMSGGDLFDKIAGLSAKLPAATANQYIAQLIGAVGYVHTKGIAHRDVRPENIMFTTSAASSALQLIDFALASACEDGKKMTTLIGVPTYCAPEVYTQSYDKKIDVYSAGVVAFLLGTGRFPIAESTSAATIAKVKAGEIDWAPIGEMLGQVPGLMKELLNKDPSARPSGTDLATQGQYMWIQELGKAGGGCCSVQ